MLPLHYEAPLKWPEGRAITPRNAQRNDHQFSATLTLDEALHYLQEELESLGAQKLTLSTDIDNLPTARLRKTLGVRSGACLTVKLGGRQYALACDRWQKLEHNLYALHLALRQMQNIERWGLAPISALLQAFALGQPRVAEAKPGELTEWMEAMGLGPTATLEDATAIYHRRAKTLTGDDKAMAQLNLLMEAARADLGDARPGA